MKRFFLPAMICSLAILSSCNNATNTSANDAAGKDTMAESSSANSDMAATGSSIMSKNGLPMSPSQEVPANNSSASGTADVSYNKDSKMLTFTVNWTGLTGAPIMAHIHGTASKGVNAGVKQDLSKLLTKSVAGSFTDSVKIDGSAIKEDSLLAGFYYFNIHTPAHPGGEIRGQIDF